MNAPAAEVWDIAGKKKRFTIDRGVRPIHSAVVSGDGTMVFVAFDAGPLEDR